MKKYLPSAAVFAAAFCLGVFVAPHGDTSNSAAKPLADPNYDRKLSALGRSTPIGKLQHQIDDGGVRFGLRELPIEEFPNAAALLVDSYRDTGRSGSIKSLLEIWAERDPQAALAWYENGMPRELDQSIRTALFRGWGRVDAGSAIDYVQQNSFGEWRKKFEASAWTGLTESDPQRAIELLRRRDLDHESSAWKAVFSETAKHNCVLAFELIEASTEGDSDRKRREVAIREIFHSAQDPALLEQVAARLGPELGNYNHADSVTGQVRVGGMSQDEFLAIFLDPATKKEERRELAKSASEFSPEMMFNALLSADPTELPDDRLWIPGGLDSTQLRGAKKAELLAVALNHPHFRDSGLSALAQMVERDQAENGLDLAGQIAEGLEGEVREQAMATIAGKLIDRDPRQALEWVAQIGDERIQAESLQDLAGKWAKLAPQDAVAWAEQQSEVSGSAEVVTRAVVVWGANDPVAAGEWLATQPADAPYRDDTLGSIALGAMRSPMEEEFVVTLGKVDATMSQIGNTDVRQRAQQQLLNELEVKNLEAMLADEEVTPQEATLLRKIFAP